MYKLPISELKKSGSTICVEDTYLKKYIWYILKENPYL